MFLRFAKALAVALVVMAAALASPALAQPHKVNYVFVSGNAPWYFIQYIAQERGFYKEENVEISPVVLNSGPATMAAMIGGSADANTTNIALVVQAVEKGADAIALMSIFDVYPHTLVLSNDAIRKSGIDLAMPVDEKVKRLKGLKIGVTGPGSGSDQLVRTLLIARGYNPDREVALTPLGQGNEMLAAFEKGLVDGFAFSPPFPQLVEKRGLGKIVIDPFNNDAPELQGGTYAVLTTSKATLAKNRPAIYALVRAFTKSIKFAKEHPEEVRKLTRKYFPNIDDPIFNAMFDSTIRAVPTSPIFGPDQYKRTVNAMNITAKTPVKAAYTDVIDSTLAMQAAKEILGR